MDLNSQNPQASLLTEESWELKATHLKGAEVAGKLLIRGVGSSGDGDLPESRWVETETQEASLICMVAFFPKKGLPTPPCPPPIRQLSTGDEEGGFDQMNRQPLPRPLCPASRAPPS